MSINELLNLTTEGQRRWIEEQEWYLAVYSEIEGAEPFIDIFDEIPNIWNKNFIEDLALEGAISEDRFLMIQRGSPLTDSETDDIRKELARKYIDKIWHSEARMGHFEFCNEDLIAVFVGQAERREMWDPAFIGLYRTVNDARKAIYSVYNEFYVSEEHLP